MDFNATAHCCPKGELPENHKVRAIKLSLQLAATNFQEFVQEFEELKIQSETYKYLMTQKKEHESKKCCNCSNLQNTIASKDNIIQQIMSALTRLKETKNFDIISDIFKLILGENTALTPPKEFDTLEKNEIITSVPAIEPTMSASESDVHITPNVSIKEESSSEIDSTPTGRISPIIHLKKPKSLKSNSIEAGVKKKCSSNWSTSETKTKKLEHTAVPSLLKTPKAPGHRGKLRQSRLVLNKKKSCQMIDLTNSPDIAASVKEVNDQTRLQMTIKKESIDCDDTIFPSPTSCPLRSIFNSVPAKGSPQKFIKPSVFKSEPEDPHVTKVSVDSRLQPPLDADETRLECSADLSPKKRGQPPKDENYSQSNTNTSLSLLQHVAQIERDALNADVIRKSNSPPKRPLAENLNVTNVPWKSDSEVSVSVLHRDPRLTAIPIKVNEEKDYLPIKRRTPEKAEDIFKEPTARTKAEKRALPGWSCDDCKKFYGVLYKDNPEMLLAKMQECSRHRGKRDPARPKTPPNFWNPRWDVPQDTEAFNRQNNAR